MNAIQLLQFHGGPADRVTRFFITEAGAFQEKIEADHVQALTEFSHELPLVCLIPSTLVFLTELELPQMGARELAQAVPFALEDQLVQDVSELYFAISKLPGTGKIGVAVIGKKIMDGYWDVLQELKLQPDVLLPNVLALPWHTGEWSIATVDDAVLLRTGECRGFAIEPSALSLLLKTVSVENPEKPEVILCDQRTALKNAAALSDYTLTVSPIDQPLPIAIEALQNPVMNLLQGSYRPKPKLNRLQKYWRWCVRLVILWIVLLWVGYGVDYFYLYFENKALNQTVAAEYHNVFPGVPVPADPQSSLESALSKIADRVHSNAFHNVFQPFALLLAQHPEVRLRAFEYKDQHLIVLLTSKAPGVLTPFVANLNANGLTGAVQQVRLRRKGEIMKLRVDLKSAGNTHA